MDAMALLCNMHADGPATIKVLRRACFSSLPDVMRARPERLADLLGVSPAYARRFVREARLLGERMGENALDIEECVDIDAAAPIDEHAPSDAPRGDATSSPAAAAFRAPRDCSADLVRPERETRITHARETGTLAHERACAPSIAGTTLRADLIDGLDASLCARLASYDVSTLEALVDAPGMKLAKRLGVPLTELMDLQLLAQRALTKQREAPSTATSSAEVGDAREHSPRELDGAEDYVIFPTARREEPAFDERRTCAAIELDEIDARVPMIPASADRGEDVGGPFA